MLGIQNSAAENRNFRSTSRMGTPDYKTLQRLRTSCRLTLERYIDIAGQSSGHLASLTPGAFDPLRRANHALLKQKEDRAHEAYLKARAALLDYLSVEDESAEAQADAPHSMASVIGR